MLPEMYGRVPRLWSTHRHLPNTQGPFFLPPCLFGLTTQHLFLVPIITKSSHFGRKNAHQPSIATSCSSPGCLEVCHVRLCPFLAVRTHPAERLPTNAKNLSQANHDGLAVCPPPPLLPSLASAVALLPALVRFSIARAISAVTRRCACSY